MRSSSVVSQIGPRAERTLGRRIRLRRLEMSAAAPANARAPTIAVTTVGIISGRTGADKYAKGIDRAGAAGDVVTSLAGVGATGACAAVGTEAAAGKSGQRVARAAVAFQTEAFAELVSLPGALAGGLTMGLSSRMACGRSSARASAIDGLAA